MGCSCLSCTNQAYKAIFKGVQLSPLGFAACQSKNCTNQAYKAIFKGECSYLHSALPLARARTAPAKQKAN